MNPSGIEIHIPEVYSSNSYFRYPYIIDRWAPKYFAIQPSLLPVKLHDHHTNKLIIVLIQDFSHIYVAV